MIFVYNFLQAVLLIITFPLLILIVLCKEKYRTRIAERLGFGLKKKIEGLNPGQKKIIWIHSLSVGEVTSALPLIRSIKNEMDVCVVFSASTRTGMKIAQEKISPYANLVLSSPLDLWPIVDRFIKLIQPDLFVLIETDFWPNWLHHLQWNKTSLVLVNGRISKESFARYKRFQFFFQRLFKTFSLLSMQTEHDASQMAQLGVPEKRIKTLGNLKYDTLLTGKDNGNTLNVSSLKIPENSQVWVCGSTHPGEEKIIISAFSNLCKRRKDCFLVLAPRDPSRSGDIQTLIDKHGLRSMRRTLPTDANAPILILDTIGELSDFYQLARIAFIGGSLIDYGGHNPLEAAAIGVPVLFGPYMTDFLEIARDLEQCGGAVTVESVEELEKYVIQIFDDNAIHRIMSEAASNLVERNSGVVKNHIHELSALLSAKSAKS